MTLFQVTQRTPSGRHAGYKYTTCFSSARIMQEKENRTSPIKDTVEEYDFKLSKKGVCALLNKVGSHPDFVPLPDGAGGGTN